MSGFDVNNRAKTRRTVPLETSYIKKAANMPQRIAHI
jgi:hypothetical protein